MCELAVFLHDHTAHPDPGQRVEAGSAQHAALYKPGDVVAVQPDGASWGREIEAGHPWFRIVKLPGLPPERVEHLLSELHPERDHTLAATTHWQRRGFYLDLDALPDLKVLPRPALPIKG